MGRREEEQRAQEQEELLSRIKLPRGKQIFGICEQRVGGSRMKVRYIDGREGICRIPGRLKRRLWVREGDVLLVEPWALGSDNKGDVIFVYKPIQVDYLRRRGFLKGLEAEEF